jgi:hypothetical protein
MTTLEKTLKISHDWAIDRIHQLSEMNIEDAYSIQSEFREWFDESIEDHDIISVKVFKENTDEDRSA